MEEKKILVTNDDGIHANGLLRLVKAAKNFGKVYVVAPDKECSAMSHRITLREHIDVKQVPFEIEGVEAYASTGTPADCVRFGILNILREKPDLVLSGINYGFNCGSDIQYSATVGAALEAACVGVHAIALSEDFSEHHEVTDAYLEQMIGKLMKRPLGYNQIWNVNFPKCPLSEFRGILENRKVAKNAFFEDEYVEEVLMDGTRRLSVKGHYHENAEEGTDFRAVVDGYISVGVVNNLSN